jgi:hypothetical protein
MSEAMSPYGALSARILHPDCAIRQLDRLRCEFLVSIAAIRGAYGAALHDRAPENQGISDVECGYQSAAYWLGENIVGALIPVGLETLSLKAGLIEAVPPERRDDDVHAELCRYLTEDAAHAFNPDSRRLAVVRSWGRSVHCAAR